MADFPLAYAVIAPIARTDQLGDLCDRPLCGRC